MWCNILLVSTKTVLPTLNVLPTPVLPTPVLPTLVLPTPVLPTRNVLPTQSLLPEGRAYGAVGPKYASFQKRA